MFVLTIDQRGSRTDVDRVDDLLAWVASEDLLRGFERTAGDEVQAVTDDPELTARIAVACAADGHWSVGIGVARVDEPLPDQTRAGRGPAFEYAREAVEAAKGARIPIAVRGSDRDACRHAQTAAVLFADVVAGRSAAGHEAVAAMRRQDTTQERAAHDLGISPQAMSQRLRAARWDIDADAEALVAELLARADQQNRRTHSE